MAISNGCHFLLAVFRSREPAVHYIFRAEHRRKRIPLPSGLGQSFPIEIKKYESRNVPFPAQF